LYANPPSCRGKKKLSNAVTLFARWSHRETCLSLAWIYNSLGVYRAPHLSHQRAGMTKVPVYRVGTFSTSLRYFYMILSVAPNVRPRLCASSTTPPCWRVSPRRTMAKCNVHLRSVGRANSLVSYRAVSVVCTLRKRRQVEPRDK
jgi:hypothetical protein